MCAMWSDPEVVRFIGGKVRPPEEVWARLLRYAGIWTFFGYGFWVIRDRASGAYIGEVGFLNLRRDLRPPFGDRPELVNEQPYGDGWLVLIEPSADDPLRELLDAAAYRAFVETGQEP